jgi:prephenate dehydrogenase
MWAQICRLNRREIIDALRAFRGRLDRLERALVDGADLEAPLEEARAARLKLSPQSEPGGPVPRAAGSRSDRP